MHTNRRKGFSHRDWTGVASVPEGSACVFGGEAREMVKCV
jgi:hypothetical protein